MVWTDSMSQCSTSQTTSMASIVHLYKANPNFSSFRPVEEVANLEVTISFVKWIIQQTMSKVTHALVLLWSQREMFAFVFEVKKTQALRCPPMSLNHPLVEQMTRRTPFRCPQAATLSACLMNQTPEPPCPPRVTFWCPTLLFPVCLVNNTTVFPDASHRN